MTNPNESQSSDELAQEAEIKRMEGAESEMLEDKNI